MVFVLTLFVIAIIAIFVGDKPLNNMIHINWIYTILIGFGYLSVSILVASVFVLSKEKYFAHVSTNPSQFAFSRGDRVDGEAIFHTLVVGLCWPISVPVWLIIFLAMAFAKVPFALALYCKNRIAKTKRDVKNGAA